MVTSKQNSTEGLSPSLASSLDEHLSGVRVQIAHRAYDLAAQSTISVNEGREGEKIQVSLSNLSQATSEVINGLQTHQSSLLSRFFEYFPPFTCVCTILCIIFAVLGLQVLGTSGSGSEITKATASFLDIAKIFAGAIVGSTASNVISAAKARRQSR